MTIRTYIKTKMIERGINQTALAEIANFKNQSNVSSLLKGDKSMRTDSLFALLDALECELVIRDKRNGSEQIISQQ